MFIKKFLEFILFGSILIAACAVALCIETNILLHLPLNTFTFYCFVFGATLAQYNFHYLLKTSEAQHSQRHIWFAKRKQLKKILFASGILLILLSFLKFHLHHFITLSVFGIIAFLYSFPVIFFGKKKRIKDFGLMKILTLCFMWTLVTVWFPVVNFSFEKNRFIFIFLQRFFFMLVICLLFDLRDIEIDTSEKIKTIAVSLGKRKTYTLTFISLALFIIISLFQYVYFANGNFLIAMFISALFTFLAIQFSKKTNTDLFYLSVVDGMMLLQAVLIYLMF